MKKIPRPCFLCSAPSADDLCVRCEQTLSRERIPRRHALLFCEGAMTVFGYTAEEVRRLVFGAKRRGLRLCVARLCRELVGVYPEFGVPFSAVTFVPRRRRARGRTGVDQAELLARRFSRETGIPCVRLLSRKRASRQQHGLSRAERRENVRGAFLSRGRMPRGNILLIDDIITTGASCEEAAHTLLRAGADAVYALAPVRGGNL